MVTFFFFNDTATTEIYTLSLHDALPIFAGFVPLGVLIDLTSMGTLVAFTVVSIGVIVLRRTQPDLPRGFRVQGYPVVTVLSALFCLYLIYGLPGATYVLFAIWLAIAAVVYVTYARPHSA